MRSRLVSRRARPADARAFSALTTAEVERGLPPSWTPARVARLLARRDTNAYALVQRAVLASDDGTFRTIEGLAGLSIATFGDEHAHLVLLAVAPGLRRQGHGGRLLDWQLKAAMTAGLTRVTLESRAGNTSALAFYRSRGFEIVERRRGYYQGREDALRLRLQPVRATSLDEDDRA